MSNLLSNLGIDENEVKCCPDCGATEVRVGAEPWSFHYTHGSAVELNVVIPIWTCGACEFTYTDGHGEAIEDEARRQFLRRRLLPREIRSIRESYGMSRAQFATITSFGETSIKRWENGTLVQNASADRFLRLLDYYEVAETLVQLSNQIDAAG